MEKCLEFGTAKAWGSAQHGAHNTRNHMCQLNSLKEVTALWQAHYDSNPEDYAAVLFARPDVLYKDPFPSDLISDAKVLSSSFQHLPHNIDMLATCCNR